MRFWFMKQDITPLLRLVPVSSALFVEALLLTLVVVNSL
jgi:hypothetical protein